MHRLCPCYFTGRSGLLRFVLCSAGGGEQESLLAIRRAEITAMYNSFCLIIESSEHRISCLG